MPTMAAPTEPASRTRCSDSQSIVDVLRPFAEKSKNWIKYDEAPTVNASKTMPELLQKYAGIIEALHSVSNNMCFTRSSVKTAVATLYSEMSDAWGIDPAHKNEYIETMTRRVVNMCRVVNQAQVKRNKAPWFLNLSFAPAPASKSRSSAAAATDPSDRTRRRQASAEQHEINQPDKKHKANKLNNNDTFFYGFSEELQSAWRKPALRPNAPQELTHDLRIMPGAQDTDCIVAFFPDGTHHEITDLTVQQWRQLRQLRRDGPRRNVLWSGERLDTHEKVEVKPRADRSKLMSIFCMGKQILQVRVDSFSNETAAGDFMIDLAKRFCNKEIADAKQLKMVRDRAIRKIKAHVVALKKPAAAPQVPEESDMKGHEVEEGEEESKEDDKIVDPDERDDAAESSRAANDEPEQQQDLNQGTVRANMYRNIAPPPIDGIGFMFGLINLDEGEVTDD